MAKKKRKTLPKNFKDMIASSDIAALKAVYDSCELDAYGGYDKETALHFYDVPDELVIWLVEQGLDINTPSHTYRRTPLYAHATIGDKTVKLLLDLGADIEAADYSKDTPLHTAAGYHRADTVKLLVERGANIHARNDSDQTALSYALARCENIHIPGMAKIARILLDAGTEITQDMIESVKHIGENFEFHRDNFNKDYLAATDTGLNKLYEIFKVEPIVKRQMHDGVSPIIVTKGSWEDQYEELWEMLIPSSGPAQTIQGEVIRITGRVRDELYRNGGANWDKDYRKMLNALPKHFASGAALSENELAEAKELASSIRARGDDEDSVTDRLCELAVQWVVKNPDPVPLEQPDYDR